MPEVKQRGEIRSSETLASFVTYCKSHPSERFWQALRNWSGFAFIFADNDKHERSGKDTFYWEGRDG